MFDPFDLLIALGLIALGIVVGVPVGRAFARERIFLSQPSCGADCHRCAVRGAAQGRQGRGPLVFSLVLRPHMKGGNKT